MASRFNSAHSRSGRKTTLAIIAAAPFAAASFAFAVPSASAAPTANAVGDFAPPASGSSDPAGALASGSGSLVATGSVGLENAFAWTNSSRPTAGHASQAQPKGSALGLGR